MRQKLAAKAATRVGACKILFIESARIEQGYCKCVTQRERRSGTCSWREPERAGFFRHTCVQVDVGVLRQRGLRIAGG